MVIVFLVGALVVTGFVILCIVAEFVRLWCTLVNANQDQAMQF